MVNNNETAKRVLDRFKAAARPDPKKPLSKEDRERMAKDRQWMIDEDGKYMSDRERRELQAEIKLLRDFSVEVGFDGNNVVRV